MTQQERILDYMQQFGSITPMQAFADLGITKLATRISELKRAGYKISDESVKSRNRYGERTRFKKYSIGGIPE